MKVDLHIHSIYSLDGKVPIKDILKIAKKVGIGALAITDHNEIQGSLKAKKLGILPVIRGIEISTAKGHVLAYMIDCKIERDLDITETIEKIHECGGIAVAAHPYRYWSGIGEENARAYAFDAIEIFNGRCKKSSNDKSKRLAEELNKPFTAGSDAHSAYEIGKAGVIVNTESEEEIIEDILKKRVEIFGSSRGFSDTMRYVSKTVSEWIGRGFKKI